MEQPLASVDDLVERVPFEMDEGELREATRALEELSDEARHYGSEKWSDPATTPRQVIRLVLKAAARHMKNYEGFLQSRAGDEYVTFSDRGEAMGDAMFTAEERKRLNEWGGNYRPGFHSVGTIAWQSKPAGYVEANRVPIAGSTAKPFPLPRPW